jgi:hypothetical protein
MPRIDLQDTPFTGPSRSVTYLRTAKPPGSECSHCGSSLAGRAAGVRKWGDRLIRVYACPCGHDRHEPVERKAA